MCDMGPSPSPSFSFSRPSPATATPPASAHALLTSAHALGPWRCPAMHLRSSERTCMGHIFCAAT
eukprot:9005174-Pyramimonas_sp.AAC.1